MHHICNRPDCLKNAIIDLMDVHPRRRFLIEDISGDVKYSNYECLMCASRRGVFRKGVNFRVLLEEGGEYEIGEINPFKNRSADSVVEYICKRPDCMLGSIKDLMVPQCRRRFLIEVRPPEVNLGRVPNTHCQKCHQEGIDFRVLAEESC